MELFNSHIIEIINKYLSPKVINNSCIYWYNKIYNRGEEVRMGSLVREMPFEGTMVYMDLEPDSEEEHPCIYLLIDVGFEKSQIIKATSSPKIDASDEDYVIIEPDRSLQSCKRNFNKLMNKRKIACNHKVI